MNAHLPRTLVKKPVTGEDATLLCHSTSLPSRQTMPRLWPRHNAGEDNIITGSGFGSPRSESDYYRNDEDPSKIPNRPMVQYFHSKNHVCLMSSCTQSLANRTMRMPRRISSVNTWRMLCMTFHVFLVAIHLVLLGVGAAGHPEHKIIVQEDDANLVTSILGAVTQTFATVSPLSLRVSSSQSSTLLNAFYLCARLTPPS